MKQISRQLKFQLEHKALGLCSCCNNPSYKNGVFCEKHLKSNGKTLRRRELWEKVDWSKPTKEIAKELRVCNSAVESKMKKLGIRRHRVIYYLYEITK